ncbi:hypothetical protein vseg_009032 [Gypsophila vaccaria]
MVEELFQGGVCGGTWWNHNLFSGGGGGGGLSSCSVAQFGGCGGGGFGWSNDFEITFDVLDFGITPTTSTIDWNNQQQNQFYKGGNNEESYESLLHDNITNSTKFPNQGITKSSINSPENSSTISYEDRLTTTYPITSSASYLIQTLFDDLDDNEPQVSIPQSIPQLINPNVEFGSMDSQLSIGSWDKLNDDNLISLVESPTSQSVNKFDGGVSNGGGYNTATNISDIRATFIPESPNCANATIKLKSEGTRHESKNISTNNELPAKRPRIETPSSLPTFKVRKEKLGDRITALQQLVSPFGKTDTASVLHEAIEYIKFLHDQVHVLSTPYLKNGTIMQHQQVSNNKIEHDKQDLRSQGLCLVPISSTYPVTQETPVDFWTPKFGGTTFR